MALQLNPKPKDTPHFDKLNAEEVKNLEPMVDMAMRVQGMTFLRQQAAEARQERDAAKKETDQNKAYSELSSKSEALMSPRGPAGFAAQADQRAQRVQLLGNKTSLTPAEMSMFANDLDAMIRGGTATVGGAKKILPDTLLARLQSVKQFLSGSPTGAGLEEFKKRYLEVANDVQAAAQQTMREHVHRQSIGYRDRVRPEQFSEFQNTFGTSGMTTAPIGGEKKPAANTEALDWAQKHINSSNPKEKEQALKILKLNR